MRKKGYGAVWVIDFASTDMTSMSCGLCFEGGSRVVVEEGGRGAVLEFKPKEGGEGCPT